MVVAVEVEVVENANLEPHAKTETQPVNSTIPIPHKFQTAASVIKTPEQAQTVAQNQTARTGPAPSATALNAASPTTFQARRIPPPTLKSTWYYQLQWAWVNNKTTRPTSRSSVRQLQLLEAINPLLRCPKVNRSNRAWSLPVMMQLGRMDLSWNLLTSFRFQELIKCSALMKCQTLSSCCNKTNRDKILSKQCFLRALSSPAKVIQPSLKLKQCLS